MTLRVVTPALDAAAVRAVIDDIDGDGSAALDPAALVALGLPADFVLPLITSEPAAAFGELAIRVAGPSTRVESVWSLDLLRAIADHYGLDATTTFVGRSRNARLLAARIIEHLDACK